MDALEAARRGSSNPLARRIGMVGRETGNRGLNKQQGTTRTIYDTIPLTGSPNVFNFFENLANKGFPWTNLNRNSFTDAEAMNIQRAYLTFIEVNNDTPYSLVQASTIQTFGVYERRNVAFDPTTKSDSYAKFSLAQASIFVSGQQILKNFSFLSADPRFNYRNQGFGSTQAGYTTSSSTAGSHNVGLEVYDFISPAVIPPNREFIVSVQVPPYVDPGSGEANTVYLRLTLEGFGAIPSVEGTL